MRLSKGRIRKLLHIHKQTMKTQKGSKTKNKASSKRGKTRSGTNHKTLSSRKSKRLHTKTQKYALVGGEANGDKIGVVEEDFSASNPSAEIKEPEPPQVEPSALEQPVNEPVQKDLVDSAIKEQLDVNGPTEDKLSAPDGNPADNIISSDKLNTQQDLSTLITDAKPEESPAAAEQPIAEQPIAEQPIAEQPIAEQPIAEQPIAEPDTGITTKPETSEDKKEREEFEKAKQETQEAEAAGQMFTPDTPDAAPETETKSDIQMTKRGDCEIFIKPSLREISVVLKEIRDAIRENKHVFTQVVSMPQSIDDTPIKDSVQEISADTLDKASPEEPVAAAPIPTDEPSKENTTELVSSTTPIQESNQPDAIPDIPNTNNQDATLGIRELANNLQNRSVETSL